MLYKILNSICYMLIGAIGTTLRIAWSRSFCVMAPPKTHTVKNKTKAKKDIQNQDYYSRTERNIY